MTQARKQINFILYIKLILLSLIFCLPKAPSDVETNKIFTSYSKAKNNSFMLPSNVHFEHKVLKKIPLLEGTLPAAENFKPTLIAIVSNPIPVYSFSKTRHFISSSFARGPPTLS